MEEIMHFLHFETSVLSLIIVLSNIVSNSCAILHSSHQAPKRKETDEILQHPFLRLRILSSSCSGLHLGKLILTRSYNTVNRILRPRISSKNNEEKLLHYMVISRMNTWFCSTDVSSLLKAQKNNYGLVSAELCMCHLQRWQEQVWDKSIAIFF